MKTTISKRDENRQYSPENLEDEVIKIPDIDLSISPINLEAAPHDLSQPKFILDQFSQERSVLKLQKDPSDVLNHLIHIKSNLIKEEPKESEEDEEGGNEDDREEDLDDSSISYHSKGYQSSSPNIIFSLQNEDKHRS